MKHIVKKKMTNRKNLIISFIFTVIAMISSVWCIYHFGMGVQPYYEENLKDVTTIVSEICWLEDGTVVEQLYKNRASYMVGVDLIPVGVNEESQGTLCVQLCDYDGNVLSQKREYLNKMSDGEFRSIQFPEAVEVSEQNKLVIRIFTEDADEAMGLVTIMPLTGSEDSILCRVNDEAMEYNLAITYLYGKWQYVGYGGKETSNVETLVASLLLVALVYLAIMFFVYNRQNIRWKAILKKAACYNNLKQMLYVVGFFCVFLSAALIAQIRKNEYVPLGVYICIFFSIGLIGCFYYFTRKKRYQSEKNIIKRMFYDKGLVIVLLISTLVRLPLFSNIQLWDGMIYYGELQRVCNSFEFSIAYIWENFRLANHYAIVYTFFTSIGEFLLPDHITGVLLVLLILTDISLLCIYKMFRGYWLDLSQMEAAVGTILVSICPLFLGLFSNISLEHLLVVFTIFLFYAEYKEQTIMKVVWMISIMLTKETGLIIVAGYLFAHICVRLRDAVKKKKGHRLRFFLMDFHTICAAGGIAIVSLYTIMQEGLFAWKGTSALLADYFVIFGNLSLVWRKFILLFVLHFEWIPVLLLIFCMIYCIAKRCQMPRFKGRISIVGALGSFLFVNFILLDTELGRYHIFSAVMIWILAYIYCFKLFRRYLRNGIALEVSITIMILLLIQNFTFIDPWTTLFFDQYDTGKGKMVSTEIKGGNLGDAFANNFRYTYLYGLIDTMLRESNFDVDTQVIVPYSKDYLDLSRYIAYDKSRRKRVFQVLPDNENTIEINCILLQDILNGQVEELPERGVMYFLPYVYSDEQEIIEKVKQFYNIGDRREASNWGGTLAYYTMEKR